VGGSRRLLINLGWLLLGGTLHGVQISRLSIVHSHQFGLLLLLSHLLPILLLLLLVRLGCLEMAGGGSRFLLLRDDRLLHLGVRVVLAGSGGVKLALGLLLLILLLVAARIRILLQMHLRVARLLLGRRRLVLLEHRRKYVLLRVHLLLLRVLDHLSLV